MLEKLKPGKAAVSLNTLPVLAGLRQLKSVTPSPLLKVPKA